MTVDQAYQILDRVIANLQLARQDHATLQQALQLLVTVAKDNREKKEDGGTDKCADSGGPCAGCSTGS